MKRLFIPLVALVVLVLDQLAKAWIASNFSLNQQSILVDNFLRIRLTHNTGAAFGVLQGATGALSIVAIAIVAAIFYSSTRMAGSSIWGTLALGLIVGGALGNLIDRLRLGYVVDFIEAYGLRVQIGDNLYTWPVFNLADSAISVGVVLLLFTILFGNKEQPATTTTLPAQLPQSETTPHSEEVSQGLAKAPDHP